MTTRQEHNSFVDALAAMPHAEAVQLFAAGLAAIDGRSSPNAADRWLAGVALGHLDEMRVHNADEMSRVAVAADDFFARPGDE